MIVFFDSSAWAKRYIEEKGSSEVEKIGFDADTVILSILCIPEIISAFSRIRREKKISEDEFLQFKNTFLQEIKDIRLINITPDIIAYSLDLLQRFTLRTLDALHIACALADEIDLFVTSDRRQMDAAQTVGLPVRYL